MPSEERGVLIIGTGGTISGAAAAATDNVGYAAGRVGVAALVSAVPALAGTVLRLQQLAQINSKDMGPAVWQRLAGAVHDALGDDTVAGIVVTHGTDTLEETAWFLHRLLAPAKPVVLTGAMRPATSLQADGPQNLLDAVTVALHPGARGVVAAMAGLVFAADGLHKDDAYRLDAFSTSAAGPVARVEEGRVRVLQPWPTGRALGIGRIERPPEDWPRVAWIVSHAGFDGALVDAAVGAGFDGLVLAGTGNGELHAALEAAAARALAAGVAVRITSRCASGRLAGDPVRAAPLATATGAAQARVEMLLELLAEPVRRRSA